MRVITAIIHFATKQWYCISMCNLVLSALMFACCYKAIWHHIKTHLDWFCGFWNLGKVTPPRVLQLLPHGIFWLSNGILLSVEKTPTVKTTPWGLLQRGVRMQIRLSKNMKVRNSYHVLWSFGQMSWELMSYLMSTWRIFWKTVPDFTVVL